MHELPRLIEDIPDMDSFAVFSVLRWHRQTQFQVGYVLERGKRI